MKTTLIFALLLTLVPAHAMAGKDHSEYPLKVSIVEAHWQNKDFGIVDGYGSGNIQDGDSFQGFDYKFSCHVAFRASPSGFYLGRWKKPSTRLEILTSEIFGKSEHTCELKTSLKSVVYGLKNDALVAYSRKQYQETHDELEKDANPPDKDPGHFPLKVTLFEADWLEGPIGGLVGSGRGNVQDGDSVAAFDFNAICAARFKASASGSFDARWEDKPKRLLLLGRGAGDSTNVNQCALRSELRADNVYWKTADGQLRLVTQGDYKVLSTGCARIANDPAPTDADSAQLPLKVAILDVDWHDNPGGGVQGSGRGNIWHGASVGAFDFNALCSSQFGASKAGLAYQGKWREESKRLLIVGHKSGEMDKLQQCELRTELRSSNVYWRNEETGAVTTLSQDEFRARRAQARSEEASSSVASPTGRNEGTGAASQIGPNATNQRLHNADVVAMVKSGLSTGIIVTKIEACECTFDTSPDGLAELKAANVPDQIIAEMIKKPDH